MTKEVDVIVRQGQPFHYFRERERRMLTILKVVPKLVFYDPRDYVVALSEEKEYVESKMAEAFMNNCNPIFMTANGEKIEIAIDFIESYKISEI